MGGRVVVVTGASGALGTAVAKEAASRGFTVAGIDIGQFPSGSSDWLEFAMGGVDLSDLSSASEAMDTIAQQAGGISALLNIAGGFTFQGLEDSDLQDWGRMHMMNLQTALVASKAAIPHLLADGDGRIVTMGAMAALRATSGMGAYAASKAAIAKLTESMADEMKGRITVNAILPTIIDTPANRADMPNADRSSWTDPADIAAVILMLLSPDARALTGAMLPV